MFPYNVLNCPIRMQQIPVYFPMFLNVQSESTDMCITEKFLNVHTIFGNLEGNEILDSTKFFLISRNLSFPYYEFKISICRNASILS